MSSSVFSSGESSESELINLALKTEAGLVSNAVCDDSSPLKIKTEMRCSTDMAFPRKRGRKPHGLKQPKGNNFVCSYCSRSFATKQHFEYHIRTHTGEKPFHCYACSRNFTAKSSLLSHIKFKHSTYRPHACSFCPRRFATKQHLEYHINTHTGDKPFRCDFCNWQSTSRSSLASHISVSHGDDLHLPFQCNLCSRTFAKEEHLAYHIASHASLKETFNRSDHTASIAHQSSFDSNTHQAGMGDKTHLLSTHHCSLCPQKFENGLFLHEHILKEHSSQAIMKCKSCGCRVSETSSGSQIVATREEFAVHCDRCKESLC